MPDPVLDELGIETGTPNIGGGETLTSDNVDQLAPGLGGMMEALNIENWQDKLQYFEAYDPVKEQMAGMQYGQDIAQAQGQAGQTIGGAYAQGRAGGGGFGGTKPTVAQASEQAMKGYDQAQFGAQMTQAKAIKSSQDAYKSQVMQLLGMLDTGK